MASVLIVNEISSEREDLVRALEAEGFVGVEAESAAEAVRKIWEGTFICAFIASNIGGTKPNQLFTSQDPVARGTRDASTNSNLDEHNDADSTLRMVVIQHCSCAV